MQLLNFKIHSRLFKLQGVQQWSDRAEQIDRNKLFTDDIAFDILSTLSKTTNITYSSPYIVCLGTLFCPVKTEAVSTAIWVVNVERERVIHTLITCSSLCIVLWLNKHVEININMSMCI